MKNVVTLRHGRYSGAEDGKIIPRVSHAPGDIIQVADADVKHMLESGAARLKDAEGRDPGEPKNVVIQNPTGDNTQTEFATRLMNVKGMTEALAKKIVAAGFNSAEAVKTAKNDAWFKVDENKDILAAVKKEFEKK